MKLKDVFRTLEHIGFLGTPEQFHVLGKNLLGQRRVDVLVHLGGVAHAGNTNGAELSACGLQDGKQRVLFLSFGKVGLSVFCIGLGVFVELQFAVGRLGFGLCGTVGLLSLHGVGLCSGSIGFIDTAGQSLVNLCEIGDDLVGIVGLPELEVGRALKELTHTLGFTDARHLDHDTPLLTFELLDVGLNNAELVDTRADNVE